MDATPNTTPNAVPNAAPMDRARLEQILRAAVKQGASDVHLKSGERVLLRILGVLRVVNSPKLTASDTRALLEAIRPPQLAILDVDTVHEADFSFSIAGAGRFRVNAFRQRGDLALIIRIIPVAIPDFKELHLPETLAGLCAEERGLILVTGATGSGKSTTLAAMVQHINRTRRAHVITIEDPIEFLFQNEQASIVQREIGTDTDSFATAVHAALRQDPDVILIGEMRDMETIDVALSAAETGHLVLATAHTTDVIRTVHRIVSVFPPAEQPSVRIRLADALRAVISLRLLRRADGSGQVPAVELLLQTMLTEECIRNPDRTFELAEHLSKGTREGMQSFDQHLLHMLRSRLITREVALAAATSPDDLDLKLRLGGEAEDEMLIMRHRHSDLPDVTAEEPAPARQE
jgi:twitching motility protein PilT